MFAKKTRGFTLLELVIAIFILVLMSMIIWQLTSRTIRSRMNQDKYNKIYQSARISVRKLADDLSMAYLAGPNFTPVAADGSQVMDTTFLGEDQGDKDSLYFNTFSHWRFVKDISESDQTEAGYFVLPDENDPDILRLMRSESTLVDKDVKEGGKAFPIAEGIKAFNMEYYNQSTNEWSESWNSKDPKTPSKLPRAARITLTFKDPMDPEKEIEFKTTMLLELYNSQINF